MMVFGFIYYIYNILYNPEALHLMPVKTESCFQQPDVEAGQQIYLNMLKFLCSVVCRKKGSSLRMPSWEFPELLHWKSTGAWLCGLTLHLCLMGITVRTVQGSHSEIYFKSFETMKTFCQWANTKTQKPKQLNGIQSSSMCRQELRFSHQIRIFPFKPSRYSS